MVSIKHTKINFNPISNPYTSSFTDVSLQQMFLIFAKQLILKSIKIGHQTILVGSDYKLPATFFPGNLPVTYGMLLVTYQI